MEPAISSIFLIALLGFMGSTLYRFILGIKHDVRRLRWQKNSDKSSTLCELYHLPQLCVAIYVENTAHYLTECLDSIAANDYPNYEIMIINNASNDCTKKVIKHLKKKYPEKRITVHNKYVRVHRRQAIASALKSRIRGEVILVLDASSLVTGSLRYMIQRMSDERIGALMLNAHVRHNYQLFGIVHEFRCTIATLQKKSGLAITKAGDAFNYASCYKRTSLPSYPEETSVTVNMYDDINSLTRQFKQAVIFEPHITVDAAKNKQHRSTNISFIYRLEDVLLVQQLLFAGIATYIALAFENSHYLLAGWLLFTMTLLIPLWTDTSRSLNSRCALSCIAPLAYPLYFLDCCIEIFMRTPIRYASNLSTIK